MRYPFLHGRGKYAMALYVFCFLGVLGGERHWESKVSCPRTQNSDLGYDSNPAGPLAPKPSPLTNMPQLFQTFVFKALLLFFRNLQIKIPTCARGKKTAKHVREILKSSWLLSHLLIRSCRSDLPLNSPYTAYLRKLKIKYK